jgi:signal transduction histidine kinase
VGWTSLSTATATIAAEADDNRVGDVVVAQTARLLGAADVRLTLLDHDPATCVLRHAVGPAQALLGTHEPSAAGLVGAVLQSSQPLRAAGLTNHGLSGANGAGAGPVLGVTLRFKGELLGALLASRSADASPFTEVDQTALQVVADLAATRLGGSDQSAALRARTKELQVLPPAWRPSPERAGDFVLITRNTKQSRDIIDADEAAIRILGYPREVLLQRALVDVMPMPALAGPVDNLAAIRGELLEGKPFTFDTVVRRRDGSLIPVRLELRNWPIPDGFIGRGVFHDLRAEEHAQAQAMQTEKLRILSEIGSGLAHALNSPLAVVMGNTEMLLSETTDPDVRSLLQPARDAAERISQAVQDLQRFARPVVPSAWTEIDVGELARETVERTRPLWESGAQAEGRPIQVCLDVHPVSPIRAHLVELQDALRELIANAVQALPTGGTICVSAEETEGNAVIKVTDDGIGMTEQVRQFCTEPFFTTRRPMANGLGLNRVYHTAMRHRGTLEIDSTEGEGTCMTLRLPLVGKK